MNYDHQYGINKPLTSAEIGKTEFFDFEETRTRNQANEIPAEKSDGYG